MALNVTVQSYAGRLDYGLIACRRAVPDIVDLGDHLLTEHQALLARAHEVLAGQAHGKTEAAAKPMPEPAAKVVLKAAVKVAAKTATKAKGKGEPKLKLVSAKAVAPKPRKAPTAKRSAVRAVR